MLESPDYFWEDDEWLHVYTRAAKYLEVERRYVDQNLKTIYPRRRAQLGYHDDVGTTTRHHY